MRMTFRVPFLEDRRESPAYREEVHLSSIPPSVQLLSKGTFPSLCHGGANLERAIPVRMAETERIDRKNSALTGISPVVAGSGDTSSRLRTPR